MNTFRKSGSLSKEKVTLNGLAITAFLILLLGMSGNYVAQDEVSSQERSLSSLPFPRHQSTSSQSEILSDYPDYLRFVLAIGKEVDSGTAAKLGKTYDMLRQRDPKGAARFLRGLRFEMVQKMEFMGANPSSMNTSNAMIRSWVKRYLSSWHREADEYLFRSIAFKSRQE